MACAARCPAQKILKLHGERGNLLDVLTALGMLCFQSAGITNKLSHVIPLQLKTRQACANGKAQVV